MRFMVCGDALFSSRNLAARLEAPLVERLQQADGGFVNAEFAVPAPTTPPACGRGYITSVRPGTLQEFADLNLKLVGFVNNHTGDFGPQGVMDTMAAAEAHGLTACGVGSSLRAARLPQFLDTPGGRVGVVATGSTRSEVFAASDSGAGTVPRPGCNPLRWGRSYVLPAPLFDQLRAADEAMGTRASMDEGLRVETLAPQGPDSFKFGSLFEGCLTIERGEEAHVRTFVNEVDARENLKSVADAAKRSDLCVFSLHTHEGQNENWYSPRVPTFIENIAHDAIDAGADVVAMHGAHFMRGIEIYNGKPIFYNLGSLLMEFEAGESIICPDMYEAYGYDVDSRPSDLHTKRAKNEAGEFIGFNGERRFSENAILQLDLNGGELSWGLLPIDLNMQSERPLSRGVPTIATPEVAKEIAQHLTEYSEPYGTKLVYNEETGLIELA